MATKSNSEYKRFFKAAILIALAVTFVASACTATMLGIVAYETTKPAAQADAFLNQLAHKDLSLAYLEHTTAEFKAAQSQEDFVQMMTTLGLPVAYEIQPWRDRVLTLGSRALISAKTTLGNGKEIDLTVYLTKNERGEWRVSSLVDRFRRKAGPGAWFRQLPSDKTIKELIRGTTSQFIRAVETGDFTPLLGTLSEFAAMRSAEVWFELVYKPFLDGEFDISGLDQTQAVYLEEPKLMNLTQGELLYVTGEYRLKSGTLLFEYWYKYEHPNWVFWWFQIHDLAETESIPSVTPKHE